VDEKKLLKYAIDYLSKYDSSKKNLLDVLKRKIFRLKITGKEKKNLFHLLDNIILNLESNKFIDDKKYTSSKIRSLSSRGKSKRYIVNYLIKKGIDKSEIDINFKDCFDKDYDWELSSAKIFVRKKNLLISKDTYEKKLAKMARAGFSYEVCKKALS
tara:strand:- start:500 stop:970 length:471 start_codon:yes stop_codon:yes gene_type:complete